MKYSELEKKLKAQGCKWLRDGKRHPLWFSPITKKRFRVPRHQTQELAKGTKGSIEKLSGVKV